MTGSLRCAWCGAELKHTERLWADETHGCDPTELRCTKDMLPDELVAYVQFRSALVAAEKADKARRFR